MEGLKRGLKTAFSQMDMSNTRVMLTSFSRNLFITLNPGQFRFNHQVTVSCSNSFDQLLKILNINLPKKTLDNKTLNGKSLLTPEMESKLFFSDPEKLIQAIDNLMNDPWVTPNNQRPQRATGRCLELISQLMSSIKLTGVRFIGCLSGPATVSKGRVATLPIGEFMRKAVDLENNKDTQKICQEAIEFYESLAAKFVASKFIFDLFAHSLDQFGLYEMRSLLISTGGTVYLDEEFKDIQFDRTLSKHLSKEKEIIYPEQEVQDEEIEIEPTYKYENLNLNSQARLHIRLSKELRVVGCVGNVHSLKDKSLPHSIGTNTIGEGNTTSWNLGSIDQDSTYLFLLELAVRARNKAFSLHRSVYVQFMIQYKHSSGREILRVVTIEKPLVGYSKPVEILDYLDQLTIIATFAKVAAYKSYQQESGMVTRFVDKSLINILRKFKINESIPENLTLLPQYFYYLRKSVFVNKFGTSLDEMVYFRVAMMGETLNNCLVMIQPQILEYIIDQEEGTAVLPDSSCMKKDVILLADNYFNFVLWRGLVIKEWVDKGYHLQEEFSNLKALLETPEVDLKFTQDERIYFGKVYRCHFGSPEERHLKSKLNPEKGDSGDFQTSVNEIEESGNFISDESSLSEFMEKLLKFINRK